MYSPVGTQETLPDLKAFTQASCIVAVRQPSVEDSALVHSQETLADLTPPPQTKAPARDIDGAVPMQPSVEDTTRVHSQETLVDLTPSPDAKAPAKEIDGAVHLQRAAEDVRAQVAPALARTPGAAGSDAFRESMLGDETLLEVDISKETLQEFADAQLPVLGAAEWAKLQEVASATAQQLVAEEEAALASGGQFAGNPLETGTYAVPVMTDEECARVTVPFGDISGRLREILKEYGFAVVAGVIPHEELGSLEREFMQDLVDLVDTEALEQAPPGVHAAHRRFCEGGLQAFPRETMRYLARSAGFMQGRGLPQGRLAWAARRHPNVRTVFQELFADEDTDVVTSLGSTFFTPAGHPAAEHSDFNAHVDQNGHDVRPGLASRDTYQGVLYIWPASADGHATTTTVWPGSHRDIWPLLMQDQNFMEAGCYGFHYCEVTSMQDSELARLIAGGWSRHARRCVVPAGGLLLWNSKTLHTGWKGGPRLAQTVCFEPASRRSQAERLAKLRLVALGLPSCHWASVCMQHDMCLGDPGSLAEHFGVASTQAEEFAEGDPEQVVLPLRPAVYSPALEPHADLQRLMQLVNVEYRPGLVGLWDADQDAAELLEASIRQEYKRYL